MDESGLSAGDISAGVAAATGDNTVLYVIIVLVAVIVLGGGMYAYKRRNANRENYE